jgi:4-amino-4-deoxy-L-arabinose transferase-like glycosyltransferase
MAILGGPAAYAVDNVGHALNGNNVLAGPAATGGMGRMGSPPSGNRASAGAGPAAAPAASTATSSPTAAQTGHEAGMGGGSISSEAIAYLEAHQGTATYLVAATGSQTTASIILATGRPVVTIGGFSGNDPAPTVSELAAMVRTGQLKYVLLSGTTGGGGPGSASTDLSAWVVAHGKEVTAVTAGGATLYEVTA